MEIDAMQFSLYLSLEFREPDGIYCRTTYVH